MFFFCNWKYWINLQSKKQKCCLDYFVMIWNFRGLFLIPCRMSGINFIYLDQLEKIVKAENIVFWFKNRVIFRYIFLENYWVNQIQIYKQTLCTHISAVGSKKKKICGFFNPSKRNSEKWQSIWACFSWKTMCIAGRKSTIKISMALLLDCIDVNVLWKFVESLPRKVYRGVPKSAFIGEQFFWH